MYVNHTICRACNYGKDPNAPGIKVTPFNEKLIPVMDLGLQPIANDFKKLDEEHAGAAPLKVMFCPRCSLAQLSVVVKPEILYNNYPYVTSPSIMMQQHFRNLSEDLKTEQKGRLGHVLEIGSNDGALLEWLSTRGGVATTTGVDPAENLAVISRTRNVNTYCGLWNEEMANHLKETRTYDTIIARHVFAHVDDWRSFVKALEIVSHEQTLVAVEVAYAKDMFEQKSWDQCYHEHLSYVSLKAIEFLLKDTAFYLHRVIRYPIHGGSIVMLWKRKEDQKDSKRDPLLESENITQKDWIQLEADATKSCIDLKDGLSQIGKTVCGFGASAKSTVWISYCGLTRKQISFICDGTPQKQNRFSPCSDIPIVDEGALLRELPEHCVIFAWNFAREIIAKNSMYINNGGKFIIPIPKLVIIDKYTVSKFILDNKL